MSTTRINYDLVVQELTRNMYPLDHTVVHACNMSLAQRLLAFRTVRFGTGRQQGITEWLAEDFVRNEGHSLVLQTSNELRADLRYRILAKSNEAKVDSGMFLARDIPDYVRHLKFNRVYIDDAGHYFNLFKLSKVYEHLATCTTDDVIIYHLN